MGITSPTAVPDSDLHPPPLDRTARHIAGAYLRLRDEPRLPLEAPGRVRGPCGGHQAPRTEREGPLLLEVVRDRVGHGHIRVGLPCRGYGNGAVVGGSAGHRRRS